jgi:hypothetical protein
MLITNYSDEDNEAEDDKKERERERNNNSANSNNNSEHSTSHLKSGELQQLLQEILYLLVHAMPSLAEQVKSLSTAQLEVWNASLKPYLLNLGNDPPERPR